MLSISRKERGCAVRVVLTLLFAVCYGFLISTNANAAFFTWQYCAAASCSGATVASQFVTQTKNSMDVCNSDGWRGAAQGVANVTSGISSAIHATVCPDTSNMAIGAVVAASTSTGTANVAHFLKYVSTTAEAAFVAPVVSVSTISGTVTTTGTITGTVATTGGGGATDMAATNTKLDTLNSYIGRSQGDLSGVPVWANRLTDVPLIDGAVFVAALLLFAIGFRTGSAVT